MEQQNLQQDSLFGLSIDNPSKEHLNDAAKWARFLAIIGFIFLGLIVVLAIFGGAYLSTMFSTNYQYDRRFDDQAYSTGYAIGMVIYYVIVALLCFFGYLFLYRFASNMKNALRTNSQESLVRSFKYLKVMFRYIGILTIIFLVLFAIIVLIAIASNVGRM